MSPRRILVLSKKSAMTVHREGQDAKVHERVEALLRANDPTVSRMEGAHEEHERTLSELSTAIAELRCDADVVLAAALDEFRTVDETGYDLVLTVGGDGTLLAASHALSARCQVLAINSAPSFSVGFFCGGRLGSVRTALEGALAGTLPSVSLTRMQVTLSGAGRTEEVLTKRVLNEVLVCVASPAATSRYILEHGDVIEEQKSSGIWIGPAAGSTAAQRSAGGLVLPFSSEKIQFVVREPYTPAGETLRLPRGLVPKGSALGLRAKASEFRVFVDGPHEVHALGIGDLLRFSASDEPLRLVGAVRRKGWAPKREKAKRAGSTTI